jgi:hypothetical protein
LGQLAGIKKTLKSHPQLVVLYDKDIKKLFCFGKQTDQHLSTHMGVYVNPPNETAASFLVREGTRRPFNLNWSDIPKGELAVVLIDNGHYQLAGIANWKGELNGLTSFANPFHRGSGNFIHRFSRKADASLSRPTEVP